MACVGHLRRGWPAGRARALDEYAPAAMVVLDLDIGHTDPQVVIPYGGRVRVDGVRRRITAR